jgi:protein O-mannosyl-transferase
MSGNKQTPKTKKTISSKPLQDKDYTPYWLMAGLLLVIIVYAPSLSNGFVNWDDDSYVNSKYVTGFSLRGILTMFTVYEMGNYHPLTLLSLAFDKFAGGGSPFIFHLTNLLLHLVNTFLVFLLINRLTRNTFIAIATFLLFAVHPLHVESVAWVSERKDVLYSCFFLLSLFMYSRFAHDRKRGFYLLSLLFFILSLLSKGQAVVLTVILPLIDYVNGRKWLSLKVLSEKLPFFILSVIFGIIAIHAQASAKAIDYVSYALPARLAFASYGLTQYLVKSILPIGLSAFYPYPAKIAGGGIPNYYWFFLLAIPVIAFISWLMMRRSKIYSTGLGIFFLNIVLLLQLIPVGSALMADRYFYIPSAGLLLCYAAGLAEIRSIVVRNGILVTALLFFSVVTFARCKVWHDGIALWDDVLKNQKHSFIPYYNRATAYGFQGRWEEAISDYTKVLEIDPKNPIAHYDRGVSYGKLGDWQRSIADYEAEIQVDPKNLMAYVNCGVDKGKLGQWDQAVVLFTETLKIDPGNTGALTNRAGAYGNLGQWENAIADYTLLITHDPKSSAAYVSRGSAYGNAGRWPEAITDFSTAIRIDPVNADAYINRGNAYNNLGNSAQAIAEYSMAIKYDAASAIAYYDRGVVYAGLKDWDAAIADFSKSVAIDPSFAKAAENLEIVKRMKTGSTR